MTLFWFFLPDCAACAEQQGVLDAFATRHPEIEVRRVDVTAVEWGKGAPGIAPPEFYPSFATQRSGQPPRTLEGRSLSLKELESWVLHS